MNELLKNLNTKQREAVMAPLGPVLVLAGAGSGKTRALTYRIAHLIREKLFRPEEILALTFTNKAAGEMKQRINKLLVSSVEGQRGAYRDESDVRREPIRAVQPYNAYPITMGTFHSVCARILRQDIDKLQAGYDRNFTIYDSDDSLRLIKQIVLELGLSENFRPQVFAYYISAAKNKLIGPGKLALDNEFLEENLKKVWREYQDALRQNNALDFDDLLGLTYQLYTAVPKVLKKYQERFGYVLVDEYQDTNHVQYELLKLLVARSASPIRPRAHGREVRATTNNIFVVGDDAQSIYGFRGANMQNILDFKKDYKSARVIILEQNYRSTKPILDVANKVIGLNPFQYEKKLWTEQRAGSKVNLYEAQDENDEARFVLDNILSPRHPEGTPEGSLASTRSQGEAGRDSSAGTPQNDNSLVYESEETPILDNFMTRLKTKRYFNSNIRYSSFSIPDNLDETVVLYRTHAQSRPLEEVLVSSGVPYQIVGGIKFYERREIKDAIAFLRLLKNPRDLVALERVINRPPRGIGKAAFKEITKGLDKYDYNFTRLLNNLEGLGLSDKAAAGAREFFGVIAGIQELPPAPSLVKEGESVAPSLSKRGGGGSSVLDIMEFLLKRTGYKELLLKEGPEGLERWENVEELYNVAGKFGSLPWSEGLAGMLEEIALMSDLDRTEEGGNKLTLMTLHSAKGLEWDQVFFVGLEEGLLPHSRSTTHPEEIAEEVRLAYVGMTRARKNLYLSYARSRQSYGELRRCLPSRILKAIPKNLLNKIEM